MAVYKVEVEWSGYSRGESVYEVEAVNEAEASFIYHFGHRISHGTTKDNTEDEVKSVKLIKEEKV